MDDRFHWYQEPIVIVPLLAFALGLAFVPFFLWGTEKAPEFFGAFTAALVAAGAVIGTARLQRSDEDRRRNEDKALKALQESLQLYGYLNFSFTAISTSSLLTWDELRTCATTPLIRFLQAKLPRLQTHGLGQ